MKLEQLNAFYENEGREDLRLSSQSPQRLEFDTAVHFLERHLPKQARILDSCAGSGVYSFHFARQGHRVVAGDIVPYNVELIREGQAQTPVLEEIYLGDARSLDRFSDGSFDAVLCMGALYHLEEPRDRERIVEESLRVLKDGGLFACTYMNRHAVILNNLTPGLDNLEEMRSFLKEGREGIFYASTPEESLALLSGRGVEVLGHVALDGITTFLHHTTGLLNADGFARWRQYHREICEIPSLLGYGYHNLLLGRKGSQEW